MTNARIELLGGSYFFWRWFNGPGAVLTIRAAIDQAVMTKQSTVSGKGICVLSAVPMDVSTNGASILEGNVQGTTTVSRDSE